MGFSSIKTGPKKRVNVNVGVKQYRNNMLMSYEYTRHNYSMLICSVHANYKQTSWLLILPKLR